MHRFNSFQESSFVYFFRPVGIASIQIYLRTQAEGEKEKEQFRRILTPSQTPDFKRKLQFVPRFPCVASFLPNFPVS